jgi:O-antigen/teichoic acid export membrane protein
MRLQAAIKSAGNLLLRGSSLVFRFALSFYIIKYLGFEAAGIYGLAVGITGIAPSLVGLGLNYFVAREVVGTSPDFTLARVKTRLLVSTISLSLATLIGITALYATGTPFSRLYLLILLLAWLETYAVDVHMPLIAQEMAIEANVITFVRLALWVPFAIAAGLLFPEFRNLEAVLVAWLLSYVLAVAALFFFIRKWPLTQALRTPVQRDWIKDRLRNSWHIHMSDLGLVGLLYIDRYIVGFMLGISLTGIYTFFWSLASALQTLIATAVVQLALPMLYKAYSAGSVQNWLHVMRQQSIKTAALATAGGIGVFIVNEICIRLLAMPEIGEYRSVFILMLLAAIVRSCSDLFSVGLTSIEKDNHYVFVNLLGIVLSVIISVAMIAAFGFAGTGIAALATAVIVAALRAGFLLDFVRQSRATA